MIKKILITIVLIITLIPITALASEGEKVGPSITIAPSVIDLDVEKKDKIEKVIKVTNNSDFPLPMKVDVNDYTVDENGVPDYSQDPTDWSPKGWIEVDPADLILEPLGSRDITLKISIPEFAEPGSHLATVLFKPILPPEYFEEDSSHVVPYIGAIIALNVKGEAIEGRADYLNVEDFLKQDTDEGQEEEFFTKVLNADVYYHKVSGNIVIKSIFNREVAVKPIEDITLFPESRRALTSLLEQDLPFGRYNAELRLSDENEEVVRNIVFWERPTVWEIIFLILRGILLIGMIGVFTLIILKRKNLKKAGMILFARKK